MPRTPLSQSEHDNFESNGRHQEGGTDHGVQTGPVLILVLASDVEPLTALIQQSIDLFGEMH